MSDPGDAGIWAAVGAAVAGGVAAARELVSRKKRATPAPEQLPEPSATSVRIGSLAVRVDRLEQETVAMRHETARKLADIYESLDELKTSHAAQGAILPRVEQQVRDLANELREDRRRKE